MKIYTTAVHNLKDKKMKFDICQKMCLEKWLQQTFQTPAFSQLE